MDLLSLGRPGPLRYPHPKLIQVTQEDPEDVSISGSPYGFSVLKRAQALGDYVSLTSRRLRTLEIRLGRDTGSDLEKVLKRMNMNQSG